MWRNRHHLLSRLAKDRSVLYVEPPLGLKALRRQLKAKTVGLRDVVGTFGQVQLESIQKNLHVLTPPLWAPVSGRHMLRKITQSLWHSAVNRASRKLGLKNIDVWLSRPDMVPYIGQFNASTLTYHVVDEYLGYSGVNATNFAVKKRAEETILKAADRVIVVSENLYKSKSPYNSNTLLLPNAVDFAAYDGAYTNPVTPKDISDLRGPILGYSGLISSRLDLELLVKVAKTYPDCQLVMMGQESAANCETELKALKSLKNVRFVGVKDISEVPHYVNSFDVCLVPYKESKETEILSPLKLYDYMALGKPIVTTSFPAALPFSQHIYLAEGQTQFVSLVGTALTEDTRERVTDRKEIAKANSWDQRVVTLAKFLSLGLKPKEGV